MGGGSWSTTAYASYNTSLGRSYDSFSGRVSGQEYTAKRMDPSLDPTNFISRECADSKEHPNTIPVILALDVTGSITH